MWPFNFKKKKGKIPKATNSPPPPSRIYRRHPDDFFVGNYYIMDSINTDCNASSQHETKHHETGSGGTFGGAGASESYDSHHDSGHSHDSSSYDSGSSSDSSSYDSGSSYDSSSDSSSYSSND